MSNNIANYKQGEKEVIALDDIVTINSLIGGCTFHNGLSGKVSKIPSIDNPLVTVDLPGGDKLAFDSCELIKAPKRKPNLKESTDVGVFCDRLVDYLNDTDNRL